MGPVSYERHGAVAVVRFERPQVRNAWDEEQHIAYFDALDLAAADRDARVIVVTGAGDCFSAGGDFQRLQHIADEGWTPYRDSRPAYHPVLIPKPIIAAVNGPAIGMGFVQALYCDLRVAGPSAKFGAAFPRLGLVAEHGLSWFLTRELGVALSMEVLLTGRPMTAERAHQVGLVAALAEPPATALDEALKLAEQMAAELSPRALAAIKHQLYGHLSMDLPGAMDDTHRLMARSLASADFKEGLASVKGRRPPAFAPEPGVRAYLEED